MPKRIVLILLTVVLFVAVIASAVEPNWEDIEIPKEWYILAKPSTDNITSLIIGVFWLQEGMPIEHIYSILGKPKFVITPGVAGCAEFHEGTILVYPDYYFFFSGNGYLVTIEDR